MSLFQYQNKKSRVALAVKIKFKQNMAREISNIIHGSVLDCLKNISAFAGGTTTCWRAVQHPEVVGSRASVVGGGAVVPDDDHLLGRLEVADGAHVSLASVLPAEKTRVRRRKRVARSGASIQTCFPHFQSGPRMTRAPTPSIMKRVLLLPATLSIIAGTH